MTDEAIKRRLAESINRSAGQHQRAIREAFANARMALLRPRQPSKRRGYVC